MRKNFLSLLGLVLLALIFRPVFLFAGISEAVTYLEAQTPDAWTTQALAAADKTVASLNHLKSVSGTLATDYAKTILALAAVGENPAVFGNINYVAKLKTYYNNKQIGDSGLVNDDVWSILALAAVGENGSTEAENARDFVLTNQNTDGGWGYAVGGESDTNDTAAAIMALLEMGISQSDSSISNAVFYLKSAQNEDGGFGWTADSDSDSGSDAWVITALNKMSIAPTTWDKGGQNPLAHMESLQDNDGGYWWVTPGTSDYNNKAMTAYAVIAAAGKSFPVSYYLADPEPALGKYHLRIEGETSTICQTVIAGETALNLVKNAASTCGYTYNIENTSYGPYLNKINDNEAAGVNGWLYFVNFISPAIGAADYVLEEGDEVLFYFGEWGWMPTRLTADKKTAATGGEINTLVEFFQDSVWQPLPDALIVGTQGEYQTNSSGKAILGLPDGQYELFAEKTNYVRSNREAITFGNGIPRNVNLVVEIEQRETPDVRGETLIFEVTPSQMDFGKLRPGESSSQTLTLNNPGTVNLNVIAFVNGDKVFTENLIINDNPWSNYRESLDADQEKAALVGMLVPVNYFGAGVKAAELIFWAKPN